MVRKFEHLNHPEPDEDGIQYYSVHEVTSDAEGHPRYERVADYLTLDEADTYIEENGIWNE